VATERTMVGVLERTKIEARDTGRCCLAHLSDTFRWDVTAETNLGSILCTSFTRASRLWCVLVVD